MKVSNISFSGAGILLCLAMLTGCGSNIIKPISKDVIGHATVRNVIVETTSATNSDTIAAKVKEAVQKEAQKELKGDKQVDLKITIDQWSGGTENVLGGSVTKTLLGSSTQLSGVVDVVDINTGEILGKYSIASKHEEGGLMGATKTISFVDTDKAVIDNFATYTINHLE